MVQQKPMYTPSEKESGKEKLKDLSKALCFILILWGILGTLISIDDFFIALQPAYDFEDLLDTPIGLRDHIEGRVLYSYGCVAETSVISSQNGKKTGEATSGYYYLIPAYRGVLLLKLPTRYYDALEALTEETFDYLNGGREPQVNAQINGYVERNHSESLQRMTEEYLGYMGFTAQDIAAMGEIYVIVQRDALSLHDQKYTFIVSSIALAAGLVLWVIRKREKIAVFFGKNLNNLGPEKEARLGRMLTQIFVDKKVIFKQIALLMTIGLVIASLICLGLLSRDYYLAPSIVFIYVVAILVGLSPLLGSKEYIIFYEHGMNYCGEAFLYEESGYPEFELIPGKNGYIVFLKLKHRTFVVTHMEDFLEKYKRAYDIY